MVIARLLLKSAVDCRFWPGGKDAFATWGSVVSPITITTPVPCRQGISVVGEAVHADAAAGELVGHPLDHAPRSCRRSSPWRCSSAPWILGCWGEHSKLYKFFGLEPVCSELESSLSGHFYNVGFKWVQFHLNPKCSPCLARCRLGKRCSDARKRKCTHPHSDSKRNRVPEI